jgi:phosphatidylserine decarboxylase
VRGYGIDPATAARPLTAYPSIGDFFTRDLAPGLRPIGSGLVSPVDGRVRGTGPITAGQLEQIKGKTYTVSDFLGDERFAPLGDVPLAPRYNGGTYLNFYLAPPDYHHIHSPVSGRITAVRAIPGALWPVNDRSIRVVDRLFAINERIVVTIESSRGLVTVVMVGATNVGRISLTFDAIRSNRFPPRQQRVVYAEPPVIAAGDRLGTFHLGSSVVVLFEPGMFELTRATVQPGQSVVYGQSIEGLPAS